MSKVKDSDTRVHELSAVAKDAFDALSGAVEIKYRDGDMWRPEAEDEEHPVVHRLRAASVESLTSDPPEPEGGDRYLARQLKDERGVNDRLRTFLVSLDAICHDAGMDRETRGQEVLTWLRLRLIG